MDQGLLREQAKKKQMPNGSKGLAERYKPHILDAAELGHAA